MESSESVGRIFFGIVHRNAGASQREWFERAAGFDAYESVSFFNAFSAASRRLGNDPVAIGPEEEKRLRGAGAPFAPAGWGLAEVGRAAMLLRACEVLPSDRHPNLLLELYYKGDNREKQAVLRSMIFLPSPERFVQIGIEACRSHVQTVFEALVCDNPFPAAF